MLHDAKSTLRCRKSRLAWSSTHFSLSALLKFVCTTSIAFFCITSVAAGISVRIDPRTGALHNKFNIFANCVVSGDVDSEGATDLNGAVVRVQNDSSVNSSASTRIHGAISRLVMTSGSIHSSSARLDAYCAGQEFTGNQRFLSYIRPALQCLFPRRSFTCIELSAPFQNPVTSSTSASIGIIPNNVGTAVNVEVRDFTFSPCLSFILASQQCGLNSSLFHLILSFSGCAVQTTFLSRNQVLCAVPSTFSQSRILVYVTNSLPGLTSFSTIMRATESVVQIHSFGAVTVANLGSVISSSSRTLSYWLFLCNDYQDRQFFSVNISCPSVKKATFFHALQSNYNLIAHFSTFPDQNSCNKSQASLPFFVHNLFARFVSGEFKKSSSNLLIFNPESGPYYFCICAEFQCARKLFHVVPGAAADLVLMDLLLAFSFDPSGTGLNCNPTFNAECGSNEGRVLFSNYSFTALVRQDPLKLFFIDLTSSLASTSLQTFLAQTAFSLSIRSFRIAPCWAGSQVQASDLTSTAQRNEKKFVRCQLARGHQQSEPPNIAETGRGFGDILSCSMCLENTYQPQVRVSVSSCRQCQNPGGFNLPPSTLNAVGQSTLSACKCAPSCLLVCIAKLPTTLFDLTEVCLGLYNSTVLSDRFCIRCDEKKQVCLGHSSFTSLPSRTSATNVTRSGATNAPLSALGSAHFSFLYNNSAYFKFLANTSVLSVSADMAYRPRASDSRFSCMTRQVYDGSLRGYTGVSCSSCAQHANERYEKGSGNSCILCEEKDNAYSRFMAVLFILSILLMWFYFIGEDRKPQAVKNKFSIGTKTFLNYLQVLSFMGDLQSQWSGLIRSMLNLSNLSNLWFNIGNVGCSVQETFQYKLIADCMSPFLNSLVSMIICVVESLACYRKLLFGTKRCLKLVKNNQDYAAIMLRDPKSTLRCRKSRLASSTHFSLSALLKFVCTTSIAFFCVTSAAAGISVQVDPRTGDDSRCSTTFICRTIAHAVQLVGVSQVNLSAGVFIESTVSIDNVSSLVVSGVPSSTFFDCSRRLGPATGTAFNINNSTVTITGVTFQHCSNPSGNGGAVSAVGSSVAVLQCSFVNCSAANGGAVSATGQGRGTFLHVQNSNFSGNAAVGGLIGCPSGSQSSEPCSTWGGAIAAFEILNVSVIGCSMTDNTAVADVPMASTQSVSSRNAVAGGGCVSVLFRGNCSAFVLHMSGNSFLRCAVHVSRSRNIAVGNGMLHASKALVLL
jgi:hypothetical protein